MLFEAKLDGDYLAGKNVSVQDEVKKVGIVRNHIITTGIDYLFEGLSVSTVQDNNSNLEPILYAQMII